MTIQETSLQAYYSIKKTLNRRQLEVFTAFEWHGNMTNLEVSKKLNLPINSVTGRVKELRDKGMLERKGSKIEVTKHSAIVWGVKNNSAQQELF